MVGFAISSAEDLKVLAIRMKQMRLSDDYPGFYSQTQEQADRIRKLDGITEEQKAALRNNTIVIKLHDHIISLCLTNDGQHGAEWHLSMSHIVGVGKIQQVCPEDYQMILDNFFSSWRPIPNPGKIHEILHFVGNNN